MESVRWLESQLFECKLKEMLWNYMKKNICIQYITKQTSKFRTKHNLNQKNFKWIFCSVKVNDFRCAETSLVEWTTNCCLYVIFVCDANAESLDSRMPLNAHESSANQMIANSLNWFDCAHLIALKGYCIIISILAKYSKQNQHSAPHRNILDIMVGSIIWFIAYYWARYMLYAKT